MIEVVLLTKRDCGLCDHAKEILLRVAPELRLHVREVNFETAEGSQLAFTTGSPFPPIVYLDGEPFSYGRLSERKLRKALGQRQPTDESFPGLDDAAA
jgi:hypothetical protein